MLDLTSRYSLAEQPLVKNDRDIRMFRSFIYHLAKESAALIHGYFGKPVQPEIKDDDSPVTRADREAEELMRDLIIHRFPDHGILGEEYGHHQPEADYQWILDPIDGTKSFICGAVTFGTLIALYHKGAPVLGAIMLPMLDHFMIGDGRQTLLNGRPVRVRRCSDLSQAILLATDHREIEKYHDGTAFEKLAGKVRMYRMHGDCYGYYLVARGFADIMIDAKMAPWDILPLIPVMKGAGCVITDYHGNPADNGEGSIAAVPAIHPDVVRTLNPTR
jgi:histidinol phosphatase-like enzyme (inositol monophosphatase family)